MKTTNQPRRLADSLAWITTLNGEGRLYVLVETRPAISLFGYCMKAGKESTLQAFKAEKAAEGVDTSNWRIMSYYSAVRWMNENITTTVPVTTNSEQPMPVIDTTTDSDESVPYVAPVVQQRTVQMNSNESVAGANAIAALIHSAINQAMDVDALKATANAKLDEAIRGLVTPTIISVQNGADAPVVPVGTVHRNFPVLLQMAAARDSSGNRLNILLHGPAGTSKSTSARQVAKALGLSFYPCSAISDEYKLFGFRTANGDVVRTAFREAWEHGGVFLFDELSGSDENAFLSFNGTLANGIAPFPDGAVERHPDCVIIAGDNVLGGATADYNGRNKMDAASMDRFVTLEWPIDVVLERTITGNDEWVDLVQSMRQAVQDMGIRDVLITPRASLFGASLIRAGMSRYKAAECTMRKSMDDQQWSKLCQRVGLSKE